MDEDIPLEQQFRKTDKVLTNLQHEMSTDGLKRVADAFTNELRDLYTSNSSDVEMFALRQSDLNRALLKRLHELETVRRRWRGNGVKLQIPSPLPVCFGF